MEFKYLENITNYTVIKFLCFNTLGQPIAFVILYCRMELIVVIGGRKGILGG